MIDISIINCLSDNYSYLIKDKKTDLVGVVDPSNFEEVDQKINKTYKKLDFILNTHHHSDHVGGNIDLKKKYNSKIICSTYEGDKIPGADIKKKDGEKFTLGEINSGSSLLRNICSKYCCLSMACVFCSSINSIFFSNSMASLF